MRAGNVASVSERPHAVRVPGTVLAGTELLEAAPRPDLFPRVHDLSTLMVSTVSARDRANVPVNGPLCARMYCKFAIGMKESDANMHHQKSLWHSGSLSLVRLRGSAHVDARACRAQPSQSVRILRLLRRPTCMHPQARPQDSQWCMTARARRAGRWAPLRDGPPGYHTTRLSSHSGATGMPSSQPPASPCSILLLADRVSLRRLAYGPGRGGTLGWVVLDLLCGVEVGVPAGGFTERACEQPIH